MFFLRLRSSDRPGGHANKLGCRKSSLGGGGGRRRRRHSSLALFTARGGEMKGLADVRTTETVPFAGMLFAPFK